MLEARVFLMPASLSVWFSEVWTFVRWNMCSIGENGLWTMRIISGRKSLANWKPHPAFPLTETELTRGENAVKWKVFETSCELRLGNFSRQKNGLLSSPLQNNSCYEAELTAEERRRSPLVVSSCQSFLPDFWHQFHKGSMFIRAGKWNYFVYLSQAVSPSRLFYLMCYTGVDSLTNGVWKWKGKGMFDTCVSLVLISGLCLIVM